VMLMSMAEWDMNRFWDLTSCVRKIPGQITNKSGPKQEFNLSAGIHVLIEPHH
jgi:hypothetical protein